MKKISIIPILAVLLSSCAMSTKVTALKGSYPIPPIIQSTDKSFDKVWDNIIDYFAQNGIPIRIIDRTSGLIISDKAFLTWSFEDKSGTLLHPRAFVVLEMINAKYEPKPFSPVSVTGEWNVRIKSVNGRTDINVNLFNIEATYGSYYYSAYAHTVVQPIKAGGHTTGVFEKSFYDAVK
jgi:hypothetical protein